MKNLRIKNETGTSADLYIYGDIVSNGWKWSEDDVAPADIKAALEALKGKVLNIYINSCGGDVFSGIAIHNMLRRHDAKTVGHVDGVAASIASVILMACDEIVMPSNAYVMIHRASTITYGTAEDMLQMAETLETIETGIIETYKLHSDLDESALAEKMAAETWLCGGDVTDVFSKGITVIEPLQAVACATELKHKKAPALQQPVENTIEMTKEIEIALALA